MNLRRRLSKHALGLWFLGLAALGLLRFWMEWREAGPAPLPPDAWSWLFGSGLCVAVGGIALVRSVRAPDGARPAPGIRGAARADSAEAGRTGLPRARRKRAARHTR